MTFSNKWFNIPSNKPVWRGHNTTAHPLYSLKNTTNSLVPRNSIITTILMITITYLWAGHGRVGHKMPPQLLTVSH